MSRKICVMGNSHVAALKSGWEDGDVAGKGFVPTFFGALSDGMATLDVVDGEVIPRDTKAADFFCKISGENTGVKPEIYDAFLLAGMGMFPTPVFNNYRAFSTPSTHHDAPHFVSDAVIADTLWEGIDGSMMMHCARTVRRVTDKPIFLAWQAFCSESLFDIEWRATQMQPILDNSDQPFVRLMMDTVEARLKEEGFEVLNQPDETLRDGVMTKAEFSRGSVLFRADNPKAHRENDVFHMNGIYGRTCWNSWEI
ncbi:hypothetical protein shim_17400 [Shimia sp. SK013]|uniref:hypothetical protein n=1 Tax=Shimia sp. SK013 TaxID=1389006 RepID=UPI0006B4A3DE|nr:hypothetical protein [Shimia sp. SK013]KPA21855.1 hypothetical protein shim_17400 [Shimia sp. SK013]